MMRLNPMSYCVTGIRSALYGGTFQSASLELGVVLGFAILATAWAGYMASRRGNKAG